MDHDLSIASLYHDYYVEWCIKKSITPVKEYYYSKDFNIGFKLPKSDTCKPCDILNIRIKDSTSASEAEKSASLKTQLELHQRRAEALQQSLKDEVNTAKETGNTLVVSFDLQQALPVSNLTVGPAFYLRKAWTFNLGVHDCITDIGYMYIHVARERGQTWKR